LWGLKLAVALVHPYILAPHQPFSPYLLPRASKKEKREQKKKESEREKRKISGNTKILKELPLPLS
jgi:hypothetical protein